MNTYIKSADRKASILLTAQFAFIGLYVNAVSNIWSEVGIFLQAVGAAILLTTVFGILFAGIVIYPRRAGVKERGYIYWEYVLEHSSGNEFANSIDDLEEEDAMNAISMSVYSLSAVADRKYRFLRYSLITLSFLLYLIVLWSAVFFLSQVCLPFIALTAVYLVVARWVRNSDAWLLNTGE